MIKPLEPPDRHFVLAALGWLELGSPIEAAHELEKIAPPLHSHPDVLEIRWSIQARQSNWEICREIAEKVTQEAPERSWGWIQWAFATRRATSGSLEKARSILLLAAERFPELAIIPYQIACCEGQNGNLKEARSWLQRAFELDGSKELKLRALDEPDLERVWQASAP